MANRKNKDSSIRSHEMLILTYIFTVLFLGLIGYLLFYQIRISEDVINSPYNRKRQEILAQRVVRGEIESADGKVLAETVVDENGNEKRNYPYKNVFAHVVGYYQNGGSGLEAYNNVRLLRSNIFFGSQFVNDLNDVKNPGDTIVSTLNYKLQKTAYDAMGDYDGAVVVMETKTGKILSLVSKPDFNPEKIDDMWDSLTDKDSKETLLLNRATQGLYPPGSTFKILTVLEYMRENKDYNSYNYKCTGKYENGEDVINCFHSTVHGEENLQQSFAHSCNASFVNIGLHLDRKKLKSLCDDFLINQDISIGVASKASKYIADEKTSNYKMMQTVIGQGDTVVTPLQMAMIVDAIANKGKMMHPYLVDHIESETGNVIQSFHSKVLAEPLSEEESKKMTSLMESVVDEGTATKLNNSKYNVAGKTGSAEFGNEKGHSHAWFAGFTTEEDSIVVCVILEDAGSGGATAAPVAKKIFDAYYLD